MTALALLRSEPTFPPIPTSCPACRAAPPADRIVKYAMHNGRWLCLDCAVVVNEGLEVIAMTPGDIYLWSNPPPAAPRRRGEDAARVKLVRRAKSPTPAWWVTPIDEAGRPATGQHVARVRDLTREAE